MLHLEKGRKLSEFSTLGIGGPISLFTRVFTIEQMKKAFSLDMPKMVIGKGSNCLFDDRGFLGLVILNQIDFCLWKEREVEVGSGYSFSLLGLQSAKRGLKGLEFASGIPASVGGAVFMNAGANGKETREALESVTYFEGGKTQIFPKEEIEFSYRFSSFQEKKGVILSAKFCLKKDLSARKTQLFIVQERMRSQPLKEKSIGCIFKNPPNASAGRLIEECGLKGFGVGGVKISEVHANFIVNTERGSAKDVRALIRIVQEEVKKKKGIFLEPEVRMAKHG